MNAHDTTAQPAQAELVCRVVYSAKLRLRLCRQRTYVVLSLLLEPILECSGQAERANIIAASQRKTIITEAPPFLLQHRDRCRRCRRLRHRHRQPAHGFLVDNNNRPAMEYHVALDDIFGPIIRPHIRPAVG